MAIDSYMYFKDYDKNFLESESQVSLKANGEPTDVISVFEEAVKAGKKPYRSGLFEVEDYSFDIEQVLNIGSQSSGAGAGKVTFNPFSITRKIDCASPLFYQKACSGTPFAQVGLGLRKSAGGTATGVMFLAFTFKLVAVKTVSWAHDDESPKETVTFEYGALNVQYCQQTPDGKLQPKDYGGWNRVKNIADAKWDDAIS
jgi:type VI secretion system secreted protein Hcp